ncbi:unnamed protein product [Pleuronectes platessa]|uniref:Uncharacterized protein n=1 Tax=Pleuronectes platessa TaxID=8262 RepID=A0A9N7YPL3_PLEPL|nr:unnamed protein product [Pleuronectes platessa]
MKNTEQVPGFVPAAGLLVQEAEDHGLRLLLLYRLRPSPGCSHVFLFERVGPDNLLLLHKQQLHNMTFRKASLSGPRRGRLGNICLVPVRGRGTSGEPLSRPAQSGRGERGECSQYAAGNMSGKKRRSEEEREGQRDLVKGKESEQQNRRRGGEELTLNSLLDERRREEEKRRRGGGVK